MVPRAAQAPAAAFFAVIIDSEGCSGQSSPHHQPHHPMRLTGCQTPPTHRYLLDLLPSCAQHGAAKGLCPLRQHPGCRSPRHFSSRWHVEWSGQRHGHRPVGVKQPFAQRFKRPDRSLLAGPRCSRRLRDCRPTRRRFRPIGSVCTFRPVQRPQRGQRRISIRWRRG